MEKDNYVTLAYWIMIAFVIACCIFVFYYLGNNAPKCLADPLSFYENRSGLSCFCIKDPSFP